MTVHKRLGLGLAAAISLFVAAVIVTGPAFAQEEGGSAIAQGFQVEGDVADYAVGALVSTTERDARTVQLSTPSAAGRLVGVISKEPVVAISGEDDTVEVATSGATLALMSDINGEIKAGDKIAASPISGVGMKATADGQIVGTAQSDFQTGGTRTQDITDASGKSHTVHVGLVPLQIDITYHIVQGSGFLPPFLQQFANTVAGKQVSLVRILFATMLMMLAIAGIFVLLYSAGRSSIASIGRNPLAEGAVRQGLISMGVIAFLILVVALLAAYLILRL
jgi:hypothetical protein